MRTSTKCWFSRASFFDMALDRSSSAWDASLKAKKYFHTLHANPCIAGGHPNCPHELCSSSRTKDTACCGKETVGQKYPNLRAHTSAELTSASQSSNHTSVTSYQVLIEQTWNTNFRLVSRQSTRAIQSAVNLRFLQVCPSTLRVPLKELKASSSVTERLLWVDKPSREPNPYILVKDWINLRSILFFVRYP